MARVGDEIRIKHMDGEPAYTGRTGYIELIDDAGQLHGTWGGCAVIPEVDEYETIERCVFCGKEIDRFNSNNAAPLKDGKCCNECNLTKVIPYRIELAKS